MTNLALIPLNRLAIGCSPIYWYGLEGRLGEVTRDDSAGTSYEYDNAGKLLRSGRN